eukprot:TRINITY_DN6303_c1_g1_i1.p1 TRINITY_DN6303_c1_g1~~TRINITY_DN6303_c1_g1_i1.p1  ORF type:complete len:302 (+),score=48.86 TRINITY_DN6303_c1_g1_i1:38-907(+)
MDEAISFKSGRDMLASEALDLYTKVVLQEDTVAVRPLDPTGLVILPLQFPLYGNWVGHIATAGGKTPYTLSITEEFCGDKYYGLHRVGESLVKVVVTVEGDIVTVDDEAVTLKGILDPGWGIVKGNVLVKNGVGQEEPFYFEITLEGGTQKKKNSIDLTPTVEATKPTFLEKGSEIVFTQVEEVATPRRKVKNPQKKKKKKAAKTPSPSPESYPSFKSSVSRFPPPPPSCDTAQMPRTATPSPAPSPSFRSSTKRFSPSRPDLAADLNFVHPTSISYSLKPRSSRVVME